MSRVGSIKVSHQWIYDLIYRDRLAGGSLWTYCRLPYQRCYQRHLAKRAGLKRKYKRPIEAVLPKRNRLRQGVQKGNQASREQTE